MAHLVSAASAAASNEAGETTQDVPLVEDILPQNSVTERPLTQIPGTPAALQEP